MTDPEQSPSEILARRSTLDCVGLVPPEMQNYNRFAAGVSAGSKKPEAAADLIKFLTSERVAEVLKKNGLEPR